MVNNMRTRGLLGSLALIAPLLLPACALAPKAQPGASGADAAPRPSANAGGAGPVLKASFEDWQVGCLDKPGGPCSAYQELLRPDTRQWVLRVEFMRERQGRTPATLMLPLGVLLSEGVTLRIDDAPPSKPYPIAVCQSQGCVLPLMLDADMMRALTQGRWLTVRMVSGRGESIELPVSLAGLAAALANLPPA